LCACLRGLLTMQVVVALGQFVKSPRTFLSDTHSLAPTAYMQHRKQAWS